MKDHVVMMSAFGVHSNLMMSVHHALTGMRLSVTTKFAFVVIMSGVNFY